MFDFTAGLLRIYLAPLLLCLTLSMSARTLPLRYRPHGLIVRIEYEGLTIFTDTTALFDSHPHDPAHAGVDLGIRDTVYRQLRVYKKDTVIFSGLSLRFTDSVVAVNSKSYSGGYVNDETWYILSTLMELLRTNRMQMLDKEGRTVNTIITRRYGSRLGKRVWLSYQDKNTGEEFFTRNIFVRPHY